VQAAKDNGVYIPTLCEFDGLKPAGACRICTVKIGGRFQAACTTPAANGMNIQNITPELEDMRKAIVEMLFVEGNHMCPTCEKSGNCELQALGYRYLMMAPRFPYLNPSKGLDTSAPKLILDRNRCIKCRRCARAIKTPDGKNIFGMLERSGHSYIAVDPALAAELTDEQARKAMDVCPVGSILRKEVGFTVPVGQRKYDTRPIGSEIEK
jgi:[NiFe] hydrogenase diaphorase moiety small subunit